MPPLFGRPVERHRILSRIAHALKDVREKDPAKDVPVDWRYGGKTPSMDASDPLHAGGEMCAADEPSDSSRASAPNTSGVPDGSVALSSQNTDPDVLINLFAKRCTDYHAMVIRVPNPQDLCAAIAYSAGQLELKSLVVPAGLDARWLIDMYDNNESIRLIEDKPPLSKQELNEIDGVLTACALGIAETGTLALDHAADQGRRIITLLPHSHICVVRADQIVSAVPEAIQQLKPALLSGQPVTWVSGPSATVDIEFTRVEGVHGPHKLWILIVG